MRARALLNHMTLLGLMLTSLGSLAFQASAAVAQTASEEADRRAAEEHFERGVALFHEGNLDAALVEMERAYELYRSPKLVFNLAQVQEERHAYVTALGLYRKYLDEGGRAVDRERRQVVEAKIRVLQTRVARLWVSSNVDGAEVFVDDAPVATLPLEEPILVNAGMRRIRVVKPGYRTGRQEFRVAGGDRLRANVPLLEEERAGQAFAGQETGTASRVARSGGGLDENYVPFWISLSFTGVATAAATTFGLFAIKANADLDDALDAFPSQAESVDDARARTRRFSLLADGSAVAAVVGAGISLYLLLDPPTSERATSTAGLRLTPTGIAGRF